MLPTANKQHETQQAQGPILMHAAYPQSRGSTFDDCVSSFYQRPSSIVGMVVGGAAVGRDIGMLFGGAGAIPGMLIGAAAGPFVVPPLYCAKEYVRKAWNAPDPERI